MSEAMVDWSRIPYPLVECPGFSLKDPALVWREGCFYLYCSAFHGTNWSRVIGYRSRDLADWEKLPLEWGEGTAGWCSPDIVRDGDRWVMTLQSWDAAPPRESRNQIFYRRSADLLEWSDPQPLASDLTEGKRAIDAAVAKQGERWYLVYKEAQAPRLATSASLDGPWQPLEDPFPVWAENYQFLRIDGRWQVVATLVDHVQGIAAMKGEGNEPADWSDWESFRLFETPVVPGFNTDTPANASCLLDRREADGWWYRAFCCAETKPKGNFDYQLGIVRSRDLVRWEAGGSAAG